MLVTPTTGMEKSDSINTKQRVSTQPLLPQRINTTENEEDYQIYPYHSLGDGHIFHGYDSLAKWMSEYRQVIIDGYAGVFWQEVKQCLQEAFDSKGITVKWIEVAGCMKQSEEIQMMVEPFLGTPDSLWGKRCTYILEDFFKMDLLRHLHGDDTYDINIIVGTGAGLVPWSAPVVYLDVPRNEIQYRMRAGSITNLGCEESFRATTMYKRFYFIDWVVLNEYKKRLLPKISVFGDVQWRKTLNWILSASVEIGLKELSRTVIRVRPWFEPGAWGGQWMKNHLKGLTADEVNYAWSFELIVPENGIVFESGGHLLEASFDFIMFQENKAILGRHAETFGDEFPIRFDFLDTWDGGNLSIQCHPTLSYIRENFGESITQDETYYILDCKEDARVYLGFQDDIDPVKFREVLEDSKDNNNVIHIEEFVQAHKASRHDLFLIPNGTIHSAGVNNLVLEISATPYIYTFKMYDWLRLDLNGEPRTISIEHAFNNLKFDRKGSSVAKELISKPVVIEAGQDWQLVHLPTHSEHFYDVHRIEFDSSVAVQTKDSCHVLMLVEGTSITIKLSDGTTKNFHFAETFVIPAAAKEYTVINRNQKKAKLIKAFLK